MIYLLIVSLIWAFSFGLIKGNLTGLDSNFVSFARMGISFLIFLPFIRLRNIKNNILLKLILIGAVQYGLMYLSYIFSYQYLQSFEVALFTIFTPLYISIIYDLLNKKFNKLILLKSVIAIIGAGVITYNSGTTENTLTGFLILQISNISFAFGQIYYKHILKDKEVSDLNIFGLLYFGAVLLTGGFSLITTNFSQLQLNQEQIFTLLYLGIVASGIAFFLWNFGARKTDAGTLSIFNNLKIPFAILVSLLFFGDEVNTYKLIIGGLIISSAFLLDKISAFREKNSE